MKFSSAIVALSAFALVNGQEVYERRSGIRGGHRSAPKRSYTYEEEPRYDSYEEPRYDSYPREESSDETPASSDEEPISSEETPASYDEEPISSEEEETEEEEEFEEEEGRYYSYEAEEPRYDSYEDEVRGYDSYDNARVYPRAKCTVDFKPVVEAFEKAFAKGEAGFKAFLCNSAEMQKLAKAGHMTEAEKDTAKNDPCLLDAIKELDKLVPFEDRKLASEDLCGEAGKLHELFEHMKKMEAKVKKLVFEEEFVDELKTLRKKLKKKN